MFEMNQYELMNSTLEMRKYNKNILVTIVYFQVKLI